MSTPDDQVAVMIPGLPEALARWLNTYHELFISRPPLAATASESERHARHMEEAGLMGQAHGIIFQVHAGIRRANLGLAPEEFRVLTPSGPGEPYRHVSPSDLPAAPDGPYDAFRPASELPRRGGYDQ